MSLKPDTLIIGCGIAGAAAALRLAEDRQREILVVTRAGAPEETNTRYAQGGIIYRGIGDSPESLSQDIMEAGAGICFPKAVNILAEEGPDLLKELLIDELEVPFDRNGQGELLFTREGAHSVNRIIHVGDATGRAIEKALIARLIELPNVKLLTGMTAVDLISTLYHSRAPLARYGEQRCCGAYILDTGTGEVLRVLAENTILATGGLGRIYRYTTNPEGARGDGMAMAYRAGARVINAEYIQFHPTTLALAGSGNFLISEAVRGEGAKLLTPEGEPFMKRYDAEWGDLASRDVVCRAIQNEMITHGYPHVLLDLSSHMQPDRIRERFPTIYESCLRAGLDITSKPIPVVPAAHYSCGGVLVDDWGRTTVGGLYAVGEVSCTGLHGGNRLASTSLLEGLVWGDRAGRDIRASIGSACPNESEFPEWQSVVDADGPDPVLMYHDLKNVQDTMWLYVGMKRNAHRLKRARRDLNHHWQAVEDFYRSNRLTDELVGLRNVIQVSWIVANSALRNRSSCGTHFREDCDEKPRTSLYEFRGPMSGLDG